jgi:hypothetical protein
MKRVEKSKQPGATPPDTLRDDMMYGVTGKNGIANFLGVSPRRAYHWISLDALPVRRVGKRIAASKKTLREFMRSSGGRA